MQTRSFYHFNHFFTFSGNADAFLLPFQTLIHFFGQCRRVPFTVSTIDSLFRAMQTLSFYHFIHCFTFSGNAEVFLLPFQPLIHFFGQCRSVPFHGRPCRLLSLAIHTELFYLPLLTSLNTFHNDE